MNGYEVQITGTFFIQADNNTICEQYLKEAIEESGLFNVVASIKQTDLLAEYTKNNPLYTEYNVTWITNK